MASKSQKISASRYPAPKLTPKAFELQVKQMFDAVGTTLTDYQSFHRKITTGTGASRGYEIDIRLTFSVFGAEYLTLVECKRYGRLVEREKVLALHAKVQSAGAHKGILCTTSGFQSGAVEYAEAHGIALVQFADGRSTYIVKAFLNEKGLLPRKMVPSSVPRIACWLIEGNRYSPVSQEHGQAFREALGIPAE